MEKILTLQRKYIIKFCTDGAALCSKKNGVQGSMKFIQIDVNGKAIPASASTLPNYFNREICLYYYIGNSNTFKNY